MSLTRSEKAQTARELSANLDKSRRGLPEVAAALGWTEDRLHHTVEMATGADPADVWELRDWLDRTVRDGGGNPVPYTVLTESARPEG
ncbi:DUF2316 family protein [Nakamurella leprariae]|uniref:DUF2316 family protein n=1 Tax=Nakamurella leprariae TaxID=2803911 RepID=A0A939BY07_9ACTN|nr:DUF2316 family protein [Nakamurella leprariae]MBM9466121.1 DUF2316 family protein [Nakamurella leprariae]